MTTIEINLPDEPSAEDLARRLGVDEWLLGMPERRTPSIYAATSASIIAGRMLISRWSWSESNPEWKQDAVLDLSPAALSDLGRFIEESAREDAQGGSLLRKSEDPKK
jgi:hypothetical protein